MLSFNQRKVKLFARDCLPSGKGASVLPCLQECRPRIHPGGFTGAIAARQSSPLAPSAHKALSALHLQGPPEDDS